MTTCKITQDILHNCQSPPIAGQKDRIIIVPRRAVAEIETNPTNYLEIQKITLKAGERGYMYGGSSLSIRTDKGYVPTEFGHGFRHRVPFRIFGNTPMIKKEIEALINEPEGVIAVVENNYKGNAGNAKYEVFGKDVGLRVTVLEDAEGRNSYGIELASSDDTPEPHLPASFWFTDETITDTRVAALLVAAP